MRRPGCAVRTLTTPFTVKQASAILVLSLKRGLLFTVNITKTLRRTQQWFLHFKETPQNTRTLKGCLRNAEWGLWQRYH